MATTTTSQWAGSGADVRTCRNTECANPGQDAIHGTGKRVKNRCRDGWRCTACGTVEQKGGK